MQLGFDNKRKTTWAIVLGVIAIAAFFYFILPFFITSSTPGTSAQAAAPAPPRVQAHAGGRNEKRPRAQSLDPTLRLDLLADVEKTVYQGNGRNIFVSQAEEVVIPKPIAPGSPDAPKPEDAYRAPSVQPPPPIPLKFYGFASAPGEPKKIFLKNGEDVFVAGEGEIVDRRYKIIRISATSVEIQDVVSSGPPQSIPLTQG